MAIVGPADDQFRQPLVHQPQKIRRHARGPVALLVPRKQISGERKAEHDLHQHQAEPKIHFPRRTIRPVDHHLHQVQHQQHDHRLGRVMVQPAQQPAPVHLILDVEDAFPSRMSAGAVGHPKKNAGDDLHEEREHQRAAPNVSPARAAGNPLVQRFMHEAAISRAMIQPVEQFSHRFHALVTKGGSSSMVWHWQATSASAVDPVGRLSRAVLGALRGSDGSGEPSYIRSSPLADFACQGHTVSPGLKSSRSFPPSRCKNSETRPTLPSHRRGRSLCKQACPSAAGRGSAG